MSMFFNHVYVALRYVTLVTLARTAIRIHGISWYLTEIRLQFGFNETAKRPDIA